MAEIELIRTQKVYKARVSPLTNNFKKLYRFDEENVKWVADHFLPHIAETRGGALSHIHRMKVFLRYVADPGFQSGVGEELGVDQSTVSRTVNYVREKIMSKAHIWIKFPQSCNDIIEAKEIWQRKYKFPMAIGVIDCTHVQIEKPHIHGDEYVNRKGVTTINVQATCNAKELFTSVDVTWPGSVHDSRIWKNSDVRKTMNKVKDAVLLGDDGYGLEPCLMTPYRNPLTYQERLYNSLFKKERVIIERCFGQVKRRFPMLQYKCRVKIENIPSMILCCFVLHNVAKFLCDDDFAPPSESSSEDIDGNSDTPDDHEDEGNILQRGRIVRENITGVIFHQNLE